jgi:hypothetical protein
MFMNTIDGQKAQPANPFGGMMPASAMNPGPIGKRGRPMAPPGMGPAMFYGGGGAGGIIGGGRVPQITKIEKIFNCVIYDKFINEFKRMLKKYPQKTI